MGSAEGPISYLNSCTRTNLHEFENPPHLRDKIYLGVSCVRVGLRSDFSERSQYGRIPHEADYIRTS